ncbi:hypothetical protein Slin15195_G010100 [Septoria linicola]|uniref:Uncharacterized protein n=1 Tax=Septoria linicola TaxID=215465 RepID=A0A9Q9AKM7_9PEZI|nr:hypothetical protein Slin14017_G010110 [Septoria linicola]USW47691.1 hypothetical protein Slin15195_G010100 [Septoria linicola]
MPDRKSLKEVAKENPTQIGDPVSLKAETSQNQPTDQDKPNEGGKPSGSSTAPAPTEGDGEGQPKLKNQDLAGTGGKKLPYNISSAPAPTEGDLDKEDDGKSLKQIAQQKINKGNPTQLGDPVSLKAETSQTEPTDQDRGALGTSKSSGKPKM